MTKPERLPTGSESALRILLAAANARIQKVEADCDEAHRLMTSAGVREARANARANAAELLAAEQAPAQAAERWPTEVAVQMIHDVREVLRRHKDGDGTRGTSSWLGMPGSPETVRRLQAILTPGQAAEPDPRNLP